MSNSHTTELKCGFMELDFTFNPHFHHSYMEITDTSHVFPTHMAIPVFSLSKRFSCVNGSKSLQRNQLSGGIPNKALLCGYLEVNILRPTPSPAYNSKVCATKTR